MNLYINHNTNTKWHKHRKMQNTVEWPGTKMAHVHRCLQGQLNGWKWTKALLLRNYDSYKHDVYFQHIENTIYVYLKYHATIDLWPLLCGQIRSNLNKTHFIFKTMLKTLLTFFIKAIISKWSCYMGILNITFSETHIWPLTSISHLAFFRKKNWYIFKVYVFGVF